MKIIVDANIVFSGILNTNGKIGDLLINSKGHFEFIASDFLRIEIEKHHSKISKISGMPLDRVREAQYQIYRDITFISEEQIRSSAWISAIELAEGVDPKDAPYIAFSKHFNCKIWSGDKALIKGLAKKKFTRFINTDELFKLRGV